MADVCLCPDLSFISNFLALENVLRQDQDSYARLLGRAKHSMYAEQ